MIEKQKPDPKTSSATGFPFGGGRPKPRIVFMGTPEFAVASLKKLVEAGHQIVGVITAPDKAAGRGLELKQSAIKQYALSKDLNVLQPEKLKDPGFLETLRALNADLQVVVAFRMLPEIVWNMPPMGTVNLHGSLLPQYRGAAPINWAIINGEKQTGVTTFKLKHEIDTGDILLSSKIPISEEETAGELHDRMKETGADLLLRTVNALSDNSLVATAQDKIVAVDPHQLKHAPKINTETCRIDLSKTVTEVYNLIRGLSPYPGAFTMLDGKTLKIYRAEKEITDTTPTPGAIDIEGKTRLRFACADGYIIATELQLEGKKRMNAADFLRGYRTDQHK